MDRYWDRNPIKRGSSRDLILSDIIFIVSFLSKTAASREAIFVWATEISCCRYSTLTPSGVVAGPALARVLLAGWRTLGLTLAWGANRAGAGRKAGGEEEKLMEGRDW